MIADANMAVVARGVSRHALAWLVLCNAVGLWLATILLWPAAGDLVAPLSYGRWMPVHLDGQLYGWCAIPLVGVLLLWCLDPLHPRVGLHVRLTLGAWSLALALGAISWLAGVTGGKLFLDWHGWARPLLPTAMVVLWAVLAVHVARRWWRRERIWPQALAVTVLLAVPAVFAWSTNSSVYPSVNPDSGGATGASLLGSSLGIIAVYGIVPTLLGIPRRPSAGGALVFWGAFVGSVLVYATVNHGNRSHHLPAQIAALAIMLGWVPLLVREWRSYAWPPAARSWVNAMAVWWSALVLTGWTAFLPGISERWKFTNALVGHAHLAMAGFVTSANVAILIGLGGGSTLIRFPRWSFWGWQLGCAVSVALLIALGTMETDAPGDVFLSASWVQAIYAGRLLAGTVMFAASVTWLSTTTAS